jgi:ABC-type nickel/cobalt efflux system permease component RcnA
LRPVRQRLSFPDGEGGLELLRLEVTYQADLLDDRIAESTSIQFSDTAYADRLGWREIIARGGPGVEIADSSIPSESISNELTVFPEGLLETPIDKRLATITVRPGVGAPLPIEGPRAVIDEEIAVSGNPDGALSRFSGQIAKDELTPGVIIVALLAAVAFGAYHALTPGHGKTVVAAYLVGSRGTAWHALLLGLVVTTTHTSTVYLVGFVALYLSQYILPEDLYPWLGIASGALILAMGLALFATRLRGSGLLHDAAAWLRPRPQSQFAFDHDAGVVPLAVADSSHVRMHDQWHAVGEAHDHETQAHHGHMHDEPHRHGFGPAHSHRIPGQDGERVTIGRLVGLGVFGGMIPCPSAIVVMLSAIALHRVAFGLVLIVAFSVGLAGVLVAIGFALVFVRSLGGRVSLFSRIHDRTNGTLVSSVVRAVPVAAAGAVTVAGLVILLRALAQQGTI